MWAAAVRRRSLHAITSSCGPLHDKAVNLKSCSYGAACVCFRALGNSRNPILNTACTDHSRGWISHMTMNATTRLEAFSTVSHQPSKKQPRKTRLCSEVGCSTTANYGWEDGSKEYCTKHKKEGMRVLSRRLCAHPECMKVAHFGMPGGKETHCGAHRLERMEDIKTNRCAEPGCGSLNPSFAVPGGKGTHCSAHKKLGMKDVKHRKCEFHGCDVQPSFGHLNGKSKFCALHKRNDMLHHTRRPKKGGVRGITTLADVVTDVDKS